MILRDDMSTREKNLSAELALDLIVAVYYFPRALAMLLEEGRPPTAAMAGLIGQTIVVGIVAGIVVYGLIHTYKKPEAKDERDQLFETRGALVGYCALFTCVTLIMGHVVLWELFAGADPARFELNALHIANLLLLSLMAASLCKASVQLFHYRRAY